MKLSIFGMGYVGAVSAACLANEGHQVTGCDIDPIKLELLRAGKSPIVETGLDALIKQAREKELLQLTDNTQEAINASEISFICVGTPSDSYGVPDLTALKRCCQELAQALVQKDSFHIFVFRSTVPPGTCREKLIPWLEEYSGGKVLGKDFEVYFQPEFLREGSSIKDYRNPPYTIFGHNHPQLSEKLSQLFEKLESPLIGAQLEAAEMLKYTANAFHALKVGFANEVGRLCHQQGIDGREVMQLICQDHQLNISPAYLRPAFAFGGSCLPKDLMGLNHLAQQHHADLPVLGSLLPSNRAHIEHGLRLILGTEKRKIALLGLSFKAGTDDLRQSPLVHLAEQMLGKGLKLRIYDPEVELSRLIGANRRYITETIPHLSELLVKTPEEALAEAEVVVVGQADKSLQNRLGQLLGPQHTLVDLLGLPSLAPWSGKYLGVCW